MKVLWLLPHRPAGAPSGGDLYDAEIVKGLRRLGHRVEARSTLPSQVKADVVVQDELDFRRLLPFNQALALQEHPARRVALVHVTTARLQPAKRTAATEARYLASTHAAVFVSKQARAESLHLLTSPCDSGERSARTRRVRGLLGVRTAVISPGADRLPVAPRLRSTKTELRFLCVGHLVPQKGQLALLEAFSGLDATLVLAGDGTLDRRYTARVQAQLRKTPGARWVGPLGRAALAKELARADVFINASDYESWGMAAAEAQAAGLPVVSWSKGGLWEFLTPGVDSLRAREPSARLLRRLLEPALLEKLTRGAEAARVRTWETAAREFEAFLEACWPLTPTLSPLRREREAGA